MGFFGMLFWMAVLWLVLRTWRRSHPCISVGPYGYWRGWYRKGDYDLPPASSPRGHRVQRDEYIDSLETRLSQLEERLDFTERLLESRAGTKT
jgi:hypothetical protein